MEAILTEEIRVFIDDCVLCWLATVDSEGQPNCSPKEVFCSYGENQLLIANIASPHSVENISNNPQVCISCLHVFKQKGYKLKGVARYHAHDLSNKEYRMLHSAVYPMVGDVFPVLGIICVDITQVNSIVAPGYYMVEGTTEKSQVENAMKVYGVKPAL